MANRRTPFSASRRALMTAGALAGTLPILPAISRYPAPTAVNADPMRAWLGQFDEGTSRWRSRSWWPTETPGDALRVVFRGPWHLDPSLPKPDLAISVLYQNLEHSPFQLWSTGSVPGQGGIVLHAEPQRLAGLRISRPHAGQSQPLSLALTDFLHPHLLPGRYLVLIDPSGQLARPDWTGLRDSEGGVNERTGCPVQCQPGSRNVPLAAMTLSVSAA